MIEKQWQNYQDLFRLSKKARILSGISHLLDWDQETYMPMGSSGSRAEQLKLLAGMIHELKTSIPYRTALEKLIDIKTGAVYANQLPERNQAALKRWHRDFVQDTALPQDFVETFAQLTSQAILVWRTAKKQNDFSSFAPFLEKIVSMSRQKADYLGYEKHPYDALMDQYEPDLTVAQVEPLFATLEKGLRPWIDRVQKAGPVDDAFLHGDFPPEKQEKIGKQMLEAMGFDWETGRLDLSTHPFSCSPHPRDNRITSRVHPTNLMSYLLAVLHEGGHALYEKGLPPEEYGSPLGDSISLGVHESQSRWWETRIGLTKSFWQYFFPILQELFPDLNDYSLTSFYRAINRVHPSLIRIEADEVTYPMHVILRFRLEKQLIEGSLAVKDVPEAWREEMKKLLGVCSDTDAEGCLQDIHWSMGGFGYFPTYTLGTLMAACFFEAFEKEFPDWEHEISQGRLRFIQEWLQKNIHQFGRQYTSFELLKKVTGKSFSEKPFLDYIDRKYGKIYEN